MCHSLNSFIALGTNVLVPMNIRSILRGAAVAASHPLFVFHPHMCAHSCHPFSSHFHISSHSFFTQFATFIQIRYNLPPVLCSTLYIFFASVLNAICFSRATFSRNYNELCVLLLMLCRLFIHRRWSTIKIHRHTHTQVCGCDFSVRCV